MTEKMCDYCNREREFVMECTDSVEHPDKDKVRICTHCFKRRIGI